jgi:hypothetical protein
MSQGTTLFIADPRDTTADVRGKIVVASLQPPPAANVRSTTNTYEVNYTRAALTPMANAFTRRGAAAVILVADSVAEIAFDGIAKTQIRGAYDVIGALHASFAMQAEEQGPEVARAVADAEATQVQRRLRCSSSIAARSRFPDRRSADRNPSALGELRVAVGEHHRDGSRHRPDAARRVRAFQLAPGS